MNGEQVGQISYDARILTKNLKSDSRTVDKIASNTGKNLGSHMDSGSNKAGNALKGLTTKLLGLAATFTAVVGVSRLLGDSFKDLAGLQTARASFEVLTGSAKAASKVMKDIATFANTTPFEFPEIAGAARTLLGFGVAAKNVQTSIEKIGDAAAASGGSVEAVSVVFGQIFAAGKLNAQDFLQLINNGIALGPEISKELGIPMSDLKDNIEDGKVTFDVFNKALTKATSKGGKYFEATSRLSLTLSGRLSTLKDTFTGFVGEIVGVDFQTGIVSATGLFAKLSDGIASLTGWLSGPGKVAFNDFKITLSGIFTSAMKVYQSVATYLAPKLQSLFTTISTQLLPVLMELWHGVIAPLIPVLGTTLVIAVGAVIDTVNGLIQASMWLIQEFKNGNVVVRVLAGAFGALAAAMLLGKAFAAITAALNLLSATTIPAVIAKMTTLKLLVMTPLVMPAIVVAAAIAALSSVIDKYHDVMATFDTLDKNIADDLKASQDLMKLARRQYDAGKISEKEFRRLIGVAARADGGPVSANKPYLVGENSDGSMNSTSELFVPRTSGTIVSSKDLQGMLGGSGGGKSIVNHIANINIKDKATADYWLQRLTGDSEVIATGLTPPTRYA